MTWYAVHLVFSRGEIPDASGKVKVEESVYLIEGVDQDEVFRKAEQRALGMEEALKENRWTLPDGSKRFTKDARFLGIRKAVRIQSDTGDEDAPIDMTEVTYSFFELETLEKAKKFADGEEVYLVCLE